MTTLDPMDVDAKTSENGDGRVSGEIEVKTASNDTGTHSQEAPCLDPLSLSKEPPAAGTGEQDKLYASADSGYQSTGGNLVGDSEPTAAEGISDASPNPCSPGPIQDEIVCAPYHRRNLPESGPNLGNRGPDSQPAPITPSKARSPKKKIILKTPDTSTTQAKLKGEDEDITTLSERRNPKRTASAMAHPQAMIESSHDDILEETLKPMEAEELGEWAGWVELESEPVRHPRSYRSKRPILCGLG